jgi:hypothetical protein
MKCITISANLTLASAAQPPVRPPRAYSDAPNFPAAPDSLAHTHIHALAKPSHLSHPPHAPAASPTAAMSAAGTAEHAIVDRVVLPPSCDGSRRTISRTRSPLAVRRWRLLRLQSRLDLRFAQVLAKERGSTMLPWILSATMLGPKVKSSQSM